MRRRTAPTGVRAALIESERILVARRRAWASPPDFPFRDSGRLAALEAGEPAEFYGWEVGHVVRGRGLAQVERVRLEADDSLTLLESFHPSPNEVRFRPVGSRPGQPAANGVTSP